MTTTPLYQASRTQNAQGFDYTRQRQQGQEGGARAGKGATSSCLSVLPVRARAPPSPPSPSKRQRLRRNAATMDVDLPSGAVGGNMTALHPTVCYSASLIFSAGVWFGDNPLNFALPRLMAEVCLIFVVESVTNSVFRRFGQSRIVSQIVAGGIVGFSGMSHNRGFASMMFPPESKLELDVMSTVGAMLFLFLIGVKTDLSMIGKTGGKAVSMGIVSTVLPFGVVALAGYLLENTMPPELKVGDFVYQLAVAWSRTSYAVLSCVLDELQLLNSKLGRFAMTATLISELINTVITNLNTAFQLGTSATNQLSGIGAFLSSLVLFAFILLVARPIVLWIIRKTPEGEHIREGHMLLIIMMVLACGLAGEIIGHHAATGTFILGLALPSGPPLGSTLQDKLNVMVAGTLVPLFMATAGFRARIFSLADRARCLYVVFFVVLSALGKFTGVLVTAWYCRMPLRDAVILALMLNTKGIFEAHTLKVWRDSSLIDAQIYTIVIICITVFCALTTFLVKTLYKPTMGYLVFNRRTIQHARQEEELGLLACVHTQQDVGPMLDLLKVIHATTERPVCIYALHLVPLVGHVAAMLCPYTKNLSRSTSWSSTTGPTDHIMNAFRFFEQGNQGAVLVQPFIAISPPATMHMDVCTLALDKKVSLVILPFHKRLDIGGTMETHGAQKTMNLNALTYAPCSVGIFIAHGHSVGGAQYAAAKKMPHHLAVYFLGGPDDREALSLATRAAENPAVGLTVIRFQSTSEWHRTGTEAALDEEALSEFRLSTMGNERVGYQEEVVKDGEGTIGVIRATSSHFTLLMVGRRSGVGSPLTEGLSMWSEYQELGVIGDVLASGDVACSVSTLVVQQQMRVGGNSSEVSQCNIVLPGMYSQPNRVVPS